MNNTFRLSQEDNLTNFYPDQIQPFWQKHVQQGQILSYDNLSLAYAYVMHPKAKACVVILAGRIEAYIKYKEVVFDLYHNGYSVFIMDHRGQGLSARMVSNHFMGYVTDFSDYVSDFKKFMEQVVSSKTQLPVHLLCHSMGCTIGALYCLTFPQQIKSIVFLAPMFGIKPALPSWLASALVKSHFFLSKLLNLDSAYFLGQKDYVAYEFNGNKLTNSPVRYAIFRQEYQTTSQAQLGGVSGHWLRAATQAMDKVELQASAIFLPALAIQAGSDQVVDNKRQRRVLETLPHCQLITIKGAQHELLMEQDQYRAPALQAALTFWAENT